VGEARRGRLPRRPDQRRGRNRHSHDTSKGDLQQTGSRRSPSQQPRRRTA
jgi:hypothetical protein